MRTLNSYLSQFDINSEAVLKEAGYTKSQMYRLPIVRYPDEVIKELAKVTHKSKSNVVLDLLNMRKPNSVYHIYKDEDLIRALDEEALFIFFTSDYKNKNSQLVNYVLTDSDLLGFKLGSRGNIFLLEELFHWIGNKFSKDNDYIKKIRKQLLHYRLKVSDDYGNLIYKEELTYSPKTKI